MNALLFLWDFSTLDVHLLWDLLLFGIFCWLDVFVVCTFEVLGLTMVDLRRGLCWMFEGEFSMFGRLISLDPLTLFLRNRADSGDFDSKLSHKKRCRTLGSGCLLSKNFLGSLSHVSAFRQKKQLYFKLFVFFHEYFFVFLTYSHLYR